MTEAVGRMLPFFIKCHILYCEFTPFAELNAGSSSILSFFKMPNTKQLALPVRNLVTILGQENHGTEHKTVGAIPWTSYSYLDETCNCIVCFTDLKFYHVAMSRC